MAFPDSFIDELIERNDIESIVSSYVTLTRRGSNLFGHCPFHNEKTPSFSVSPSKQIYYCFGCSKGGGVINFVMQIENLAYPDAIHFLANKAGMTVPENDGMFAGKRARLLELNRDAARYFHALLKEPAGEKAVRYIQSRMITNGTVTRFGLGCAPEGWDNLIRAMTDKGYEKSELIEADLAVDGKKGRVYDKFRDRLMFPVINLRGEVVGFGGRSLDGSEPKYLNSKETPVFSKRKTLYGMNRAKNTNRGNIILCEGNVDVITLHQAGFDNAVASMGTSLTTDQIKQIARYKKEIVICYDNDGAGKQAALRAIELLKNSELAVKVLSLPDRIENGERIKTDADDYIKIYGTEAFARLLDGSGTHAEYMLSGLESEFDLGDDEQRVGYLKKACEMIAKLPSPVEREIYGARAAEKARVTQETVAAETSAIRRRLYSRQKKETERAQRPQNLFKPAAKSIKYSNIRSAAAEEGVIRLILLDSELFSVCNLEYDEFSEPFLGKLYNIIKTRHEEGKSLSPPSFSQVLSEDEMSQFVRITQKPESIAQASQSLEDYISVIRTERLKNAGAESLSGLLAISEKMRERKGYGG